MYITKVVKTFLKQIMQNVITKCHEAIYTILCKNSCLVGILSEALQNCTPI